MLQGGSKWQRSLGGTGGETLPLAVRMSWSEAAGQADHNLASGKVFLKNNNLKNYFKNFLKYRKKKKEKYSSDLDIRGR